MRVGVAKETAPGERRVALVPEAVEKLRAADVSVLVERGAGVEAWFPDIDYAEAGAKIVTASALYSQSDVILKIHRPSPAEMKLLHQNQVVVGMLAPLLDPGAMVALAGLGVVAISLDAIPRTLSRSQGMDALSSQANVAGYKAVLVAAEAFGRYFPLLTTPAGTAKPANVLVLGVGVAGLQALATARRLGAQIKAYDVRPETREQAESLGAQFVTLRSAIDGAGQGGYARALTPQEQAAQQDELNDIIVSRYRHHDRPGPRPATAGARDRHRRRMHEGGLDHRRHGRQRSRGQLRAVQARQGDDHPERRGHPRTAQPAGVDADGSERLLFPQHPQPVAQLRHARRTPVRLRGRGHGRYRHHPRRQGGPGGHQEAPAARIAGRRQGMNVGSLLDYLTVFVLAILLGFEVISKVPATLHTPLMSGTNSIHGIVLVGAIGLAATADSVPAGVLAFVAMAFAGANVVGGYWVTDRMLQMFKRRPVPTTDKAAK